MNAREKLQKTLSFENCTKDGGAVLETFYPWDLTVERFLSDGMPKEFASHDVVNSAVSEDNQGYTQFLDDRMTENVYNFEKYFGFDPMKRLFLQPPFKEVAVHGDRPPVVNAQDWEKIKEKSNKTISEFFTDENIKNVYGKYSDGHKNGDFSIRFAIQGFFWVPRDLFGIEEHMLALYDEPELMHDIISYMCDYYITYLEKIFNHIVPDVVYIMEDLSGRNGPMISPTQFDEYIGAYYKKLIPFLKSKGVHSVFVDTDGDFEVLIPSFIKAGVEGFLPMDVNAGMDVVKIREKYPKLKFIGAFNKLMVSKGKEAIDKEFERILPVIRQGGYVPGNDHQLPPDASIEDYKYYIKRLKEVMQEAGANINQ